MRQEEERLPGAADPEEARRESSGEYLFRVLRPAGAVLVLVLMVLFLLICFTHRSDPVRDYIPAHTPEYYTTHIPALEAELRQNLLRYLPECTLRAEEDRLYVTAAPAVLENLRESLTGLFGEAPFVFSETRAQADE